MDAAVEAAWPVTGALAQLLDELAHLIARGGAWRFLHAPVLAPDDDAYPEPWDGTRAALGAVLARTMWHARLDLDVRVDDARAPARASERDLRTTRLALVDVDDRGAAFTISEIGNDDVAGVCAHAIGRVLVAQLERGGAPFRSSAPGGALPGLAIGSVGALYAGLGVIATNAARYDRSAGRMAGSMAVHEFQIAGAGGLDSRDLAFLLAVQATVRDDVLPALGALHPTQAADVAAWREVLDDHEDELVARLGLRGADDGPPPRADAPRAPIITARFDERDLTTFNLGKRVWGVRKHRGGELLGLGFGVGGILGAVTPWLLGAHAAAISLGAIAGSFVVGPAIGWTLGRRWSRHECSGCHRNVELARGTCRFCGGRIAGELLHEHDRFERDDELDALERGGPEPLTPGE